MTRPIRILIADDHTVVRKGIRTLLLTVPGLEVVGDAGDGATAVEQYYDLQPDVLLLDLKMPGKGGLEVIQEIRQRFPAARILVLTSYDEDEMVLAAIQAGALGYIMKDSTPEELLQAIQQVARGHPWLQPTIAFKLMQGGRAVSAPEDEADGLTEREVEVLKLVAQGLSNQEIADKLIISERTVRTHISHILNKLQLDNRTQAALYALRRGWASLREERGREERE